MRKPAYMTTSWDDGHPLDFRLADMLVAHRLCGTFYVPKQAENVTMTPEQLRQLAGRFEIGAHTMRHVFLDGATELLAEREITESKAWVEGVTGRPCTMFCPPGGRFDRRHLRFVRQAGYVGLRSVELMSIDLPRETDGLLVMPTTLQAHPHQRGAYLRNAAKRGAARNLWTYLLHGTSADWVALAASILEQVARDGGVFHLWGHSWELEETRQWKRLEQLFSLMSEFLDDVPCLSNAQVCAAARSATVLPIKNRALA